jgi:ketosteroid isomerase-like protein
MSNDNVELARRGFAALKSGDLSEAEALLDPDVKWHWGDPNAIGACRNRSEALAFMRRPERRGPGELVDVIDAGDRVVVITRPPASAAEPEPLHAQITTFRDGRVVEMVGYPSVEAALDAAGVSWEGPARTAT